MPSRTEHPYCSQWTLVLIIHLTSPTLLMNFQPDYDVRLVKVNNPAKTDTGSNLGSLLTIQNSHPNILIARLGHYLLFRSCHTATSSFKQQSFLFLLVPPSHPIPTHMPFQCAIKTFSFNFQHLPQLSSWFTQPLETKRPTISTIYMDKRSSWQKYCVFHSKWQMRNPIMSAATLNNGWINHNWFFWILWQSWNPRCPDS